LGTPDILHVENQMDGALLRFCSLILHGFAFFLLSLKDRLLGFFQFVRMTDSFLNAFAGVGWFSLMTGIIGLLISCCGMEFIGQRHIYQTRSFFLLISFSWRAGVARLVRKRVLWYSFFSGVR
jgi:hypothetical protein